MNDPKTILEPIGGYLLDLAAKLRNDIFVPHSLTKLHNIARVRWHTGATSVIEVGSFKGVTTRRLSRIFDCVHSIEIDPTLFEHARRRCADCKNITFHLGDGKVVLTKVAADVQKCIIFLDGHFSGEGTGHGDEPEPVLAELDIISRYLPNFLGIVVDDFHEFGVAEGWPRKSEVMAKLECSLPEPEWMHAVMNDQFISMRRERTQAGNSGP
jgi:hypothetical protein